MSSDSSKLYYAAIWRRCVGFLIDGLLLTPLLIGFSWVMRTSPRLFAAIYVPFSIVMVAYWVVSHAIWGKSIGKHCVGIWVTRVDGSCIGWREASLRQLVLILFSVAACFALIPVYLKVPVEGYAELASLERAKLLRSMWPDWYEYVGIDIQQIWFVATAVTVLLNKKRRALHDFIAGTIVIQKKPTRRQLKREDLNQMDMNKEMKRLMKL